MTTRANSTPASLVATPVTDFATIERTMGELGLVKGQDAPVAPSMLPGEPEFAHWLADDGETRVHYSFNPVVLLRVLTVDGSAATAWRSAVAQRIPHFGSDDLRALLHAPASSEILLGLHAAVEMRAIDVLPDVDVLRVHVDQRVSRAAARTGEKLSLAVLEAGAARLAEEQRRRPDRSAVFPRIGDAAFRRETLLWMLRDVEQPNAEVAKVLRAALADADWRVRVTAMLVAARLKTTGVWQDIRYMQVPGTGPRGLDRRHQSLLGAVRKAVLAELAGEPREAPGDQRASLLPHLRAVVAGEDDGIRDEAREWIEGFLRAPEHDAP